MTSHFYPLLSLHESLFQPYLLFFPQMPPQLCQFLTQCRRAPVNNLTANVTLTSAEARERNTFKKWLPVIICVSCNALTHFCVYCRVFSAVSRAVGGYCRSFLRLLAAGTGCRLVRLPVAVLGGGFPAVTHAGRRDKQRTKHAYLCVSD